MSMSYQDPWATSASSTAPAAAEGKPQAGTDAGAESDQFRVTTTPTDDATNTDAATSTGPTSPLAAHIEVSRWSREDLDLALQALNVLLMALVLYLHYHD